MMMTMMTMMTIGEGKDDRWQCRRGNSHYSPFKFSCPSYPAQWRRQDLVPGGAHAKVTGFL